MPSESEGFAPEPGPGLFPELPPLAEPGDTCVTVWVMHNPSGSVHAVLASEEAAAEWLQRSPSMAGNPVQSWCLLGAEGMVMVSRDDLRAALAWPQQGYADDSAAFARLAEAAGMTP